MLNYASEMARVYYALTNQPLSAIPTGHTPAYWAERCYRYQASLPDVLVGGRNASFWLEQWYYFRTGQNHRHATGTLADWFWLAKLYDQVLRGANHNPNGQVGYNSAAFWANQLASVPGLGGGSAPAFDPSTLTSPVAAIDFHESGSSLFQDSAGTTPATANNDPIGRAAQISGFSATPAIQATTAAKPTLKTGANGINNHNAASCDGGDFLAWTGISAASGARTYYVVLQPSGTGLSNRFLFDSLTGRQVICYATSTAGQMGWFDSAFRNIAAQAAGNQILAFGLNGASSFIERNGSQVGTGTITNAAIGSTTNLFASNSGLGGFYTGLFGAIYIYNALHSTAERGAMYAYLAARWGIS